MKNFTKLLITLLAAFCCTLTTWAEPYNGTPQTPAKITANNYGTYGFTEDNWSAFSGYYGIRTAEELYGFAKLVNGGTTSANAVLTADIVVNENVLNADGTLNGTPTYSWTPIGTLYKVYPGTFDGNSHTISGLYFNNTTYGNYPSGGQYVGLIGYANGAKIKNVGVIDSYIKGNSMIGGICGFGNSYNTTITNCYNTGTVSGSSSNVGGICGYYGTIINCYNTGTVSGSSKVGGICGDYGTLTNCYYLADCGSQNTNGVSATAEEFASGKIAWLLNGSTSGGIAWRQTIGDGNDAYPVLDNTHAVVYATQPCPSFSNDASKTHKEHPSTDDVTGYCTTCGQFTDQATLVTASNYGSLNLTADFVGYYAISNSAQLYWFANEVSNGNTSANAVLTANIEVNENVLNAEGELNGDGSGFASWTPIGTSDGYHRYKGTFDGNGHTIRGLYFNNTTNSNYPNGGNYVGLIGYADGATIKNVGVIDSYIKGYLTVGGICGYGGTQTNCYNTGTVSGNSQVGGICGYGSTQTNCYNTGMVSGSGNSVGGICGNSGTQNNCYYLADCGSKNTLGVSATADEFASGKIAYLLNGSTSEGDLAWYQTLGDGNDATPVFDNTHGVVYAKHPCPSEFSNTDEGAGAVKEHLSMDVTGYCTACGRFAVQGTLVTESNYSSLNLSADFVDYYAISNSAELYWFANEVNNGSTDIKAVLTADIEVNGNVLNDDGTLNSTPTYSWTPIGTASRNFKGIFDGNGHTISGLYFSNTTYGDYPNGGNNVGLIGYPNGATIKNVGVIDSYLKGFQYVGGICGYGYNSTTITNCHNAGTVSGQYVGGICGYGYNSTITNCHNTGSVSGSYVGGICGGGNGTQTNCYNTGTVSSSYNYVGGICGRDGTQTNCYNTGTVSGSRYVGGICGEVGTQTKCYNTGTVSGSSDVGGICGGSGTQTKCYYLEGCGSKNALGVSAKSKEFASGKIAWLLNGSVSGDNNTWRQTLGSGGDAYPVLDNTHGVVYTSQPCTSEFSNTNGAVKEHPSMNTIGHCTACDKIIAQGTMVTESNYGSLNLTADFVGYYAISNSAELYWFADKVNTNGGTSMNAVLTADIVVNEKVLKADGTLNGIPTYDWTPIGTSTYRYAGTFDGNGHTISGLYLVYTTNDYYPAGGKCVGLIGYASGATIKNVGVVDSYLYGYQYVGGICGLGLISTNITNCYNTGTVSGYYSYSYAGGICGSCSSSATQTNCYSTGAVSGTNVIGGICGGGGTQTNCYYLAGSCSVSGGGVSATAAELASGKIACLLNNGESTIWRQDLYSDALPSFDVGKNPATGYIVEDGDTYTVVGDMFLATNYEIPEGKTLNVLEGTSLTTTGEAVITNNGTMVCNGTIAGNNLAGNGTFVTNRLSLCSISNLNESYVYKSTAYTLEAGLSEVAVNTTILGKTFTLDATISPSYANNRNVGTATISWTNNADANDVISRTFDITAYPLTISNIKAEGKTYDGNTATTVSYTADVFSGDDVTFGTAATFADKNVGTGKAVSFNYTKSGADAANYAFANETGETTANITPKNLTVSNITANGKVYDGDITAEGSYTYNADIVDGDDITVNYTAAFEDKNVGTTKRVDFSFTKTGADAGNYQFTNATDHATANITARTLTLSNFVANGKTYDGTTNATGGAFSDNRVSGDVLQFTYDYSFVNKNVGNGKDVNFSNIAISGGADKDNYSLLTISGKATANIGVKTLTISNIAATNKTYNGNTETTVSYTADVFSGDDVTFGTAATFDNKNAGTGKQVTFNYTKSGADAANYAFANESGSTTANIEPRELAISSVSAAGKEYDGNTATTVTIAASNIVSGDVVTFGTAAAFDDKNVGTNKTVNFNFTKSGTDAANYSFANATGTATANITARTLTLSNFVANGKTYDGTTNATGGAFSDNRVSGDVLGFTYDYSFENKNAGTNKNVNFSNIAISGGADKSNYTLAATTGAAKADITVKTLAISNIKAENKTYDGNTTTSVSYTTDKVATDDVTFGTTATFADKNVGNGKAVSFNYTKSGADAANYAFANATGSVTADITPKAITISNIVASSKEYDGSAVAEGTYSYVGVLENDDVEISYTANFADKTVGTDKPVTFNFAKSGADAENYVFEIESSEPKANITAKTLTLSDFVASDKVYDGTTVATNGAFADNRVAGDELEFTFDYEFETENAGENISVIFSNIAVSGADAENYELATLEGTAKATISPITDEVVVTVELADKSIDYDGEQHEYTAGEAWTITSSHPLYNAQQYIADLEMGAEKVQGTDAGEYAFGWSSESFENDNANFTTVRFDVTDGALVINKIDGVQVTIAGVRDTAMYDGLAHTVEGFAFSASNALYKETDMVNNGLAATATQTEVGETKMGLIAANFANVSRNFSNVTFSVEDGGIVVEPKNGVVVTITENSGTVAYNGEEQTVSGYAFASNSELYKETDFTFDGVAEVKGTVAGTYEMNISAEDFENANANFVDVTFNVVDGKLTIEKSEETPNMPELTIETHMLKLTYVELPEGWAWEDETLGLVEGENEVVANYVGADAGNYTTEKVTITITRLACLHDGEHVILGAKEPTCTVDGYTGDLSCSICGLVYEQGTVIPAKGHEAGKPVEENRKEPTCMVAGSVDSVVYCTIDHEELSRETYVLPMLEHVADEKVAENYVAPTFTAEGSVDSVVYCTIGGEELSRETFELPMLQKAIEKIEVLSMPKTEYVVGEDIDITGAKISVTFNDGSVEEIDLTNEMLSGFDNTLVAEQDITVTYLTFTTTIHVTVNEKTAVSDIATDATSIYAYGHTIVVETTLTGDIIVNDVNGRIVAKSQSNGDRTEIYVPKVGVYAVRIGTVSQKVVVR